MIAAQTTGTATREDRFVDTIIKRCQNDKGLAARLRRADNPATEYQSWEVLASLGIDLEKEYERLPFVVLAAAIAKSKTDSNGSMNLGRALAACYEEGRESDQAKARLRRVLACQDLSELCRVLRSVFALINSKTGQPLDFARLLKQLRRFAYEDARNHIKAQWAQEFYGQPVKTLDEEVGA